MSQKKGGDGDMQAGYGGLRAPQPPEPVEAPGKESLLRARIPTDAMTRITASLRSAYELHGMPLPHPVQLEDEARKIHREIRDENTRRAIRRQGEKPIPFLDGVTEAIKKRFAP